MSYKSIFVLTIPVMLGYIPLGIAFGLITVQSGVEWYMAPIFSLLVFAGAIQFLAIPMLVVGESYVTIAIAAALVNIRHIFYGLSMTELVPNGIIRKLYFIFCITDENYSLLTSSREVSRSNSIYIVFINHVYWILGALIGAVIGDRVDVPEGLDFALTALFCVLFLDQVKVNPSARLLCVAAISSAAALIILPSQFMLSSSILVVGLLIAEYKINHQLLQKHSGG